MGRARLVVVTPASISSSPSASSRTCSVARPLPLHLLEDEHGNIRAALAWASEVGEGEIALRLTGALWRFWHGRGHLVEGRGWLESALE